ncbi:hypothetical protein EDC96DRAFT_89279 [Choanephora cucurbitarum]|nr:hypothetical protein EDC96DRAFT_89279 [Choanephora cucurbitarum]
MLCLFCLPSAIYYLHCAWTTHCNNFPVVKSSRSISHVYIFSFFLSSSFKSNHYIIYFVSFLEMKYNGSTTPDGGLTLFGQCLLFHMEEFANFPFSLFLNSFP